jgi:colanic acid/amylovoran biosynthesis protein
MRVCILGASLDVGNRGVLALGVSLAHLVKHASAHTELAFHYGNSSGGWRHLPGTREEIDVQVLNCRMSPRSALREHILVILALAVLHRIGINGPATRNPWLASLLAADLIGDIRGGDSFSDIYGLRRFLIGSLPLLSVALLGRPFVLLPQTYGPFRSRLARATAAWLLRRARLILTRDRHCIRIVEQLCGRRPIFCPDVAFTLEARTPTEPAIVPAGFQWEHSLLVGINVSGLLYMGGYDGRNMFGLRSEYRGMMRNLIASVLTSTNATIVLIPHEFGTEQEEEASRALLQWANAEYPGRVFMLAEPLSERQLKWVIGRMHFFIGARMHACIAALSQYVPTVGLAYSDKFFGVFQSAGVGGAIIDLRTTSEVEVLQRTRRALDLRFEYRAELQRQIPRIEREIRQVFRDLIHHGGGQNPGAGARRGSVILTQEPRAARTLKARLTLSAPSLSTWIRTISRQST